MTDPIRVPVLPREDNYGDCSYDYVRIDANLARRIVALAGIGGTITATTNPDGSPKPAALRLAADGSVVDAPSQPKAVNDDTAAVDALARAICGGEQTFHGRAINALAAIKAGKVPGVAYMPYAEAHMQRQCSDIAAKDAALAKRHQQVKEMHAEIAAIRAELAAERSAKAAPQHVADEADDPRDALSSAEWRSIRDNAGCVEPTQEKTQPVADDAAFDAVLDAYWNCEGVCDPPWHVGLRAILAAIRAGKVPGVAYMPYAERAEADNREINRLADIVADDGERIAVLTAQRDRLAGLLADILPIAAAAYEDEHSAGTIPGSGYTHRAQHLAGAKWGWRGREVYANWKAGADAALAELEKKP